MSEALRQRCVFPLVLLPFLLILFSACQAPPEQMAPTDQDGAVREGGGETELPEKVVFWINDQPVTDRELELFGKNLLPGSTDEHGHQGRDWQDNPVLLIKPYLRQYALLEEAGRRGILEEEETRKILEIAQLDKVGREYRGFLVENTPIPQDRLDSKIPDKWIQMNFLLHRFDAPEKAQKAYERILEEGFDDRKKIIGQEGGEFSARERSRTGLIFRDSGFFTPFDDPYLFTLEKGDISRPIETGVGLALAEVVEKKVLSQEEINEYLESKVTQVVTEFGQRRQGEIIDNSNLKTFSEAIKNAVYNEMNTGGWSKDVVSRIGDIDMTYYQFRRLFTPNFAFYIRVYGMENVPARIEKDINEVSEDIALGVYAMTQSEVFQPTGVEPYLERRKKQLLRSIVQERLYWDYEYAPAEEQIKDRYESNKAAFVVPATIKLYTYFTPVAEDINLLWKRHEEGVPFPKLGEGLKSAETSPHGGQASLKVKERTIQRGSEELKPLQDTLFSLDRGDVRLLEVDTGYYLVKVADSTPERALGYEEVKGQLIRDLSATARREHLEEKIRELESQYDIRMNAEGTNPEQAPPVKTPSLDQG